MIDFVGEKGGLIWRLEMQIKSAHQAVIAEELPALVGAHERPALGIRRSLQQIRPCLILDSRCWNYRGLR